MLEENQPVDADLSSPTPLPMESTYVQTGILPLALFASQACEEQNMLTKTPATQDTSPNGIQQQSSSSRVDVVCFLCLLFSVRLRKFPPSHP